MNDILCKDHNKPIWYICSLKPFTEEEKENNPKFALIRQKIFTTWFLKHKSIFPDIKFATFGAKESILNKEPIHIGFVYHRDFEKFDEIKEILDLISSQEISTDKETYSYQY